MHFYFRAYSNKVTERGAGCAVDRCGMLTVITLDAERKIVCGSQSPLPFAIAATYHHKTEIFTMVILIIGQIVEHHTAEHLLDILTALCQESGESQ